MSGQCEIRKAHLCTLRTTLEAIPTPELPVEVAGALLGLITTQLL